MRRQTRALMLIAAVGLSACAQGGPDGTTSKSQVTIETITVDAAAVQAAAPPSTGSAQAGLVQGFLGYVPDSKPTRLVVFCHGYGNSVEGAWRPHVEKTVRPDTAVVTTNYRDNLKFPTLKGAHDTIAATLLAMQRFPSIETVYLFGVSMGGAVSGTALTESVHVTADGSLLYDYWIDVEGVSMLAETWAEATGFAPETAAEIEDDAGGTPFDVPEAYERRSPVLRAQDIADGGLRAAVVVHDVNDGLVPYNQGREMAKAFAAAGVPTQLFTVLRHAEGQAAGTTGSGAIFGAAGLPDPIAPLQLAGHAWEGDPNHPVMRTALEQLNALLDGTYDEEWPYDEFLVDDGG